MEQIGKSVNSFLGSVVGVGLICFASFILLLASAQLNSSRLGDLLAGVAGETARTARTESFVYWGRVASEVANGFGQPLPSLGGGVVTTPIIVVTTGPAPIATVAPAPTRAPVSYVRSTPYSEGGLLLWRGLDATQTPLPLGVNLNNVRDQAVFALNQNPGDLLAIWLASKIKQCEPLYNQMVQANYQDPAQSATIRNAADGLLSQCNPRLYEAYARKRWAGIAQWLSATPLDYAQAPTQLAGLRLVIGGKLDGPARTNRPQDLVEVTVQSASEFALPSITFRLTVETLDRMLGANAWQLNAGPYTAPGELFPANAGEPALPTEADLTPPVAQAALDTQAQGAVVAPNPGLYVVQSGDTLYKIARTFGISPQALIDANRATVGFNPDFIQPGMQLRIP
ncbi:MAG: LysM peptidoglycan-binding domain-containing protein [Anaerolineales bacterium]